MIGETFGNIQVERLLGKGGMGEVYAGFDQKLHRQVALKSIRKEYHLDPQAQRRLLQEARMLSKLSHPSICLIHDYIETPDFDLLVLELVEGRDLKSALAEGLEPSDRLPIAEQLADALVTAHAEGIVHRDLKPANVMLTGEAGGRPRIKVLDFGIARPVTPGSSKAFRTAPSVAATADAEATLRMPTSGARPNPEGAPADTDKTKTGFLLGTPLYMSPEQASGEPLTPASDMYSFGLLLHELFTGRPPRDPEATTLELVSEAARGGSRATEGVRSDLTTLIEELKSPDHIDRPTAKEALDRLAFIRDRPKRWARRITAVAATIVLLGAGLKYHLDVRDERNQAVAASQAEHEARAHAEEITHFLVRLFEGVDPYGTSGAGDGSELTVRSLLDRGRERLAGELETQPLRRAELLRTLGEVYRHLGLYSESAELSSEALRLEESTLGAGHPATFSTRLELGTVALERGEFDDAEASYRLALALVPAEVNSPAKRARALTGLGAALYSRNEFAAAEPILQEALALQRLIPEHDEADLATTLERLGDLTADRGRLEEAESHYLEAAGIRLELFGESHPATASLFNSLGLILKDQGRIVEAEPYYRRTLEILRETLGDDHPEVGAAVANLGRLLHELGRYDDAEVLLRRALEIDRASLGADHPFVAVDLNNLGFLLWESGQSVAAEPLLREGAAIARAQLGTDHRITGSCLTNLAWSLLAQGRIVEAEALFREGLEIRERVFGPDHAEVGVSLLGLGAIDEAEGDLAEAERKLRRSLAIIEGASGEDHPLVAKPLQALARVAAATDRPREAEAFVTRALEIRRRALPPGHPLTAQLESDLHHLER